MAEAQRGRWVAQMLVAGAVGVGLSSFVLALAMLPLPLAILGALALSGLLVAAALGWLERLLLVAILVDITIPVDSFLGYREQAASYGAIGGWNISVTTLGMAGLALIWSARLLARLGRPLRLLPEFSAYPLLYLAAVLLSLPSARDLELALFEVFLLLQALLIYLYVINHTDDGAGLRRIVMVLVASLAVEGVIMVGLRLLGSSVTIAGVDGRLDPDGRVGGTIGSPNGAASYLTLLIALSFSVLLTNWPRGERRLAGAAFALGLLGLLLTQSRGGLIACVAALALICAAAVWRGWLSPVVPLLGVGAAALLAIFFHNALLARLLADDGGSGYSRIPMMNLALKMIADAPLLGVGANNYAIMIKEYLTPEFDQGWIFIVHNNYLLLWAEKGIVGLLAFLLLLWAMLREGWRGWARRDRAASPIALGLAAAIAAQLFHMSIDVFNGRTYMQLFWLIAALLAVISRMDDRQPAAGRRPPAAGARSGVIPTYHATDRTP